MSISKIVQKNVDNIKTHINQSQIDLINGMIARLEGEKREVLPAITVYSEKDLDISQERNRNIGHNKALQIQIDYLKEELNKINQ